MIRHVFTVALLLSTFSNATAENIPQKWNKFTSEGYIYAVESDVLPTNSSQSELLNTLLDRARLNVAKQIDISIRDNAKLVKRSLDGVTSISYSSNTSYSTEATMHLLRTDTDFQSSNSTGYAIAFLDKKEVCGYWSGEAERLLSNQENDLSRATRMISLGYKEKAKPILEQLVTKYESMEEPLIWLELCSLPKDKYQAFLDRLSANIREIDSRLLSLGHDITIFIDYRSDLFGDEYPSVIHQLSSKLSSQDRSFVDNPLNADWIVKINAKAREGQASRWGNTNTFFSYVDVDITVIKGSTAQIIYKNSYSVKEGDTRSYKHAAVAAFNKVPESLFDIVNNNIKE